MSRKYLNYAVFIAIVAFVAGTAVMHSRRIAADVNAMAGPDRAARIAAAKELVHAEQFMDSVSGEPQARRVRIVRALEDWGLSDEPNATDPSDATKKFGPKNAVAQLVQFSKDPDRPVRDRVLVALMRTGTRSLDSLQEVVNGLKEGDGNIRANCVKALTFLGQTDATGAAKTLPESIPAVVGAPDALAAAQGLWQDRRPDVAAQIVPKVVAILQKEGGARASAGDVLGGLPAEREESVRLLVPLLGDKDEGVRTGAADALGKVGSPSAVPALLDCIAHGTPQVRRVSIAAVALIAAPAGEPVLVAAVRNPGADNEARAQAAMGLGRLADPTAIQTLIAALSDYDLKLRAAAVSALSRAGAPAVPALSTLLQDRVTAPEVRALAAQALGSIAPALSNAPLVAALDDPDPTVRAAGATALARPGSASAVPRLLALLSEPDGRAADAAVAALAAIGAPARAPLAHALASPNDMVAYRAATALARQGAAAVPAIQQEAAGSSAARRWADVALRGQG